MILTRQNRRTRLPYARSDLFHWEKSDTGTTQLRLHVSRTYGLAVMLEVSFCLFISWTWVSIYNCYTKMLRNLISSWGTHFTAIRPHAHFWDFAFGYFCTESRFCNCSISKSNRAQRSALGSVTLYFGKVTRKPSCASIMWISMLGISHRSLQAKLACIFTEIRSSTYPMMDSFKG